MRFEEMRYGLIKPVIATFYHWHSPDTRGAAGRLTKDMIDNDQPFYVSDDIHTWASPWLEGCKLYAVDCLIAKPFPLFEQFIPRELMNGIEADILFKRELFDSVIYTPHPFGRGHREMALLRPKQQILSIVPITYNVDEIKRHQKTAGWNWTTLMGWHNGEVVPPWEEQPEMPYDAELSMLRKQNNEFHQFMNKLMTTLLQAEADDRSEAQEDDTEPCLSPATQALAQRDIENRIRTQPPHVPESKLAQQPEPENPLTALEKAAMHERIQLIKTFPPEFAAQQKAAAHAEGFELDPDQIVIGGWVYDWRNSIEEIIDALQNDTPARNALKEYTFHVGSVNVGLF
jgi:hypothetical protein